MLRKFFLLCLVSACRAQFQVPDVTIEAFRPKGFRAYIADTPGIQLFAFHGKINSPLSDVEPGEFTKDILKPDRSYWVYEDSDIVLEVGDVVHYWIFVQYNRLGFRRDDLSWKVEELIAKKPLQCDQSITIISDRSTSCQESLIFQEDFGDVDQKRWVIEHYIPKQGPNYEFNNYENSKQTVSTANGLLKIRPIPKDSENDVRGILDMKFQCTSKFPEECFYQHLGAHILPPVRSGKLRSKFTFKYGKIEIRAKLPSGDWIFPEISLVPVSGTGNANASKIWIGYARGNENLAGASNDDIGGRNLFAGLVVGPREPRRSSRLVNVYGEHQFSGELHKYTLVWTPDKIEAFVDSKKIGESNGNTDIGECYISLGVGVGGINDFPDDYKSGTNAKPWRNADVKQLKSFFAARNQWIPTWQDSASELQVDYVKIYSL